jgi:hypothetical protein
VPDHQYTTENLRFHSTEQALADLAYFSQRATFPGLDDQNLTAPGTPWILLGGSYAGQISAFARIQYPSLFWGALSSSGVTTAAVDNWMRYDTIRRHGPPACVSKQQQLINLMDNVHASGNKTALAYIMTSFNISTASTYQDLGFYLTVGLGAWQQSWTFPSSDSFSGTRSLLAMGRSGLTSSTRARLLLRGHHQPVVLVSNDICPQDSCTFSPRLCQRNSDSRPKHAVLSVA